MIQRGSLKGNKQTKDTEVNEHENKSMLHAAKAVPRGKFIVLK